MAQCHYQPRGAGGRAGALTALAAREGLDAELRVRALAQRGVVELEAGRGRRGADAAAALKAWRDGSEEERLDEWLRRAGAVLPGRGLPRLVPRRAARSQGERRGGAGEDAGAKAQMLLTAQGHYIRAIRMRTSTGRSPRGSAVGELYDELRAQLLEAPLPPGFDEEQATATAPSSAREVRVLAEKAIDAYEQTLALAARAGSTTSGSSPTRKAARAAARGRRGGADPRRPPSRRPRRVPVHRVEVGAVALLDRLALELLRGRHLALRLAELARHDGEPLHASRSEGAPR